MASDIEDTNHMIAKALKPHQAASLKAVASKGPLDGQQFARGRLAAHDAGKTAAKHKAMSRGTQDPRVGSFKPGAGLHDRLAGKYTQVGQKHKSSAFGVLH